jgi:hypothetical protein
MKKYLQHLEEAAIGGHPEARFNLGAYEWNNGRYERAVRNIMPSLLSLDMMMHWK